MYDGNTWKMPTHGGFDNDIGIVSTALGYILGGPLPKPVKWLVGY